MGGKILHFVQNDIPYIGYDIYDVPPYLIRGNATPKLSILSSHLSTPAKCMRFFVLHPQNDNNIKLFKYLFGGFVEAFLFLLADGCLFCKGIDYRCNRYAEEHTCCARKTSADDDGRHNPQ